MREGWMEPYGVAPKVSSSYRTTPNDHLDDGNRLKYICTYSTGRSYSLRQYKNHGFKFSGYDRSALPVTQLKTHRYTTWNSCIKKSWELVDGLFRRSSQFCLKVKSYCIPVNLCFEPSFMFLKKNLSAASYNGTLFFFEISDSSC